jgi:uncharacterized membrane protein
MPGIILLAFLSIIFNLIISKKLKKNLTLNLVLSDLIFLLSVITFFFYFNHNLIQYSFYLLKSKNITKKKKYLITDYLSVLKKIKTNLRL